ncbi:MAG: prolyl oligopeptidase family serine peptidase [Thermotogae bacterium]|nr:prolyl oligopeptidase family serine peptidase [Thermotogota bacterium]
MLDTVFILGPFLAGVRESFVTYNFPRKEYYRSPITEKEIRWEPIVADTDGYFRIKVDTSNLRLLNEEHGLAGINLLFYVKGALRVDIPGVYLIRGRRVSSLKIGNDRWALNYYGDYEGLVPLNGEDSVEFAVGGLGRVRPFKLELRKAPDTPFVYEGDLTLPDLIVGEKYEGYAGLTLANPKREVVWIDVQGKKYRLEPLSFLKVPVKISVKASPKPGTLKLHISVNGHPYPLNLTVKKYSAPFVRRTFISRIDSSVQYYAVKFPKDYNPRKPYGLVLSLHGAAVLAERRCAAHKHRKREIVICPTNRRRWGFDWEDWGRLDALEALENAKRNFKIKGKPFLMGTSMGGHGSWHLCTSYPSIWRACMPAAAWLSIDLYIPTHLQRYRLFGKTPFVELQERLYQQTRTTQLFENLLNLPVVILQGGKDDNVPPFHARLASDILDRFGAVYRLIWRAEKGHWWEGSVDDPDYWKWAYRLRVKREERTFYTYDLGVSDSAFGIRILETDKAFYRSGFRVVYGRRVARITTVNVRSLVLLKFRGKVVIDGDTLNYAGEVLVKYRRWKRMKKYIYRRPILMRDVFFKPFILIYSSRQPWSKNLALYFANTWWSYANGKTYILPDTALTPDYVWSSDFNLVVLGSEVILPSALKTLKERVKPNRIEVVPVKGNRLMLVYNISDTSLVPLLYSMAPSFIRSVRTMPSWVELNEKAKIYGIGALRGGLKTKTYFWMGN